jgi:hypothetical protein
MSSTIPNHITRKSAFSWICSLSPAFAALIGATLAVHGWILGESARISETTGPALFQVHLLVLGVLVLFATWICLSPRFRQPFPILILQVVVFIAGWLLLYGSMLLVEASPARHAF